RWGALCALGQAPGPLACGFVQPRRLRHRGEVRDLLLQPEGNQRWSLAQADGETQQLQVDGQLAQGWRASLNGVGEIVQGVRVAAPGGGQRWHLQAAGVDWWAEDVSYLPPEGADAAVAAAELRAPFNGRLVHIAVQPGQALEAGAVALVIESMKLEHSLSVRAAAVVESVLVGPGQQVAPGQVLLRLAPAQGGAA
ncbi:MAG: carbamoyl-phosphate synthase large subunit, partial [Comamonas sp.]|nr:carbamoyl-phosphate synthase large subunit [Comamonas sp.]